MTRPIRLPLILFLLQSPLFAAPLVFPPYLHSYGIRKATPAHLFMFFGPTTAFDNPQGLATAMLVSRDDTAKSGDDDEVVVYGVNAGRHEVIYNTSMWGLARFGSKGSGRGQFFHPRGIAADIHGNVVVADSGNNRIARLYNPKQKVAWVGAYTGKGSGDAGLSGPVQVALDEDRQIYVSDRGNRRIAVMDTAGRMLRSLVPPGGAFEDGPTTLAVADGSARWSYFRGERVVFCADRDGTRLWKIGFDGKVAATVTMPAGGHAAYAATDFYHNLWVTDTRNSCIRKFDHDLRFISTFGSRGDGDNQFEQPTGIAIWKRFGQTFVAERTGAQYYWIGTSCDGPSLTGGSDGGCALKGRFTEYSFVSLLRADGADTVKYLWRRLVPPGLCTIDLGPVSVSPCAESKPMIMRVEPTYSSYTYYWQDYPVVSSKE